MKTIITLDDEKFEGKYYEAAHVQTVKDNGVKMAKYVDLKALLQHMIDSRALDDPLLRIGRLPQGFFDGAIRYAADDRPTGHILTIIPKGRRMLQFEHTRYDMCYPALLFHYRINGGKVTATRIFAVKGKSWSNRTRLYNYPFGNVSVDGGHTCWGSNQLPAVDILKKLEVVTSLFFDSPCNNDYYKAGRSTKLHLHNLRELLEELKDKAAFPDEILVKSGMKSIGEIIETIK